jgi:hypothetical protein
MRRRVVREANRPNKLSAGERHGKLVVMDPHICTWLNGKMRQSLCQCDCGSTVIVTNTQMTQTKSLSCGCSKRYKTDDEAAFYGTFNSYVNHAKKSELMFELSVEEFQLITSTPCFYCGANPSNEHKSSNKRGRYRYSGIDRIDNNLGYSFDNCVPCCRRCNVSKNKHTVQSFIEHCTKVAIKFIGALK